MPGGRFGNLFGKVYRALQKLLPARPRIRDRSSGFIMSSPAASFAGILLVLSTISSFGRNRVKRSTNAALALAALSIASYLYSSWVRRRKRTPTSGLAFSTEWLRALHAHKSLKATVDAAALGMALRKLEDKKSKNWQKFEGRKHGNAQDTNCLALPKGFTYRAVHFASREGSHPSCQVNVAGRDSYNVVSAPLPRAYEAMLASQFPIRFSVPVFDDLASANLFLKAITFCI